MEVMVIAHAPTMISPKFALSSRSSSSSVVSWKHEIRPSMFSARTGICLEWGSLSHPKACHSLGSSNSEVYLGIETATSKGPQSNGSKVANTRLELKKECQYGEHFLVVGEGPVLGSWNPLTAIPLNWSDGHIWTIDLELPIGKAIHYKFICKLSTGEIVWQPGPDRTIRLFERRNVVTVREEWENVESQNNVKQEETIVDTRVAESSNAFEDSRNPDKKVMAKAENDSNVSRSAQAASIVDDMAMTHKIGQNLSARDHVCVKKDPCISTSKTKEHQPAPKNKKSAVDEEEDGVSLVIYDEGCVLVPGMTLHVITEEALAKELKSSILGGSSNGTDGESLVKYDEGQALVPGFSAQMLTEEVLAKEMDKSSLGNMVNGGDQSVRNDEEDVPPW